MPPGDIPAEMCILGSVLMAPQMLGDVVATIRTADFVRGAHQTIYDCMKALHSRGEAIDHVTVRNELERTGGISGIGGDPIYLHKLLQSVPTVAHLPEYVERVRRCGILRRGVEVGTRMVARAYDGDDDVDAYIAEFDAEVRHLAMYNDVRIESLSTVTDFCNEQADENRWLIPGVLQAQERVIVVATEGAGKSTLARQVALCLAAGIHPFDVGGDSIAPVRTLYVDLENPPDLIRRRMRSMESLAARTPQWDPDRAWRWTRPGGIDLKRARDQHLMERVIKEARPGLLLLGPLYKSFIDGGERAEQLNSQVAAYFDRLREKYDVALWLETHAPLDNGGHRAMRPMGSGVWSRWPEFGIALLKSKDEGDPAYTYQLDRFRGDRDDRSWPIKLYRDTPWPFSAIHDEAWHNGRRIGVTTPNLRAVPDQ
jgi:hypothetical protein